MSAVSSESPRASADLTALEDGRSAPTPARPATEDQAPAAPPADRPAGHPAGTDFGPNQWLVDELYQRYLADPGSVDKAWWNFFADYEPQPQEGGRTAAAPQQPAASPAAGTAGEAVPAQPAQSATPASAQVAQAARAQSAAAPSAPAQPA